MTEHDMPNQNTVMSMEHFAGGSALNFMNMAENPELMKP